MLYNYTKSVISEINTVQDSVSIIHLYVVQKYCSHVHYNLCGWKKFRNSITLVLSRPGEVHNIVY